MKIFTLMMVLSTILFSKVYYSKVEPYEFRDLSSNVSGVVEYINEDMIGQKLGQEAYLRIDSELDLKELSAVKEKLLLLRNTLASSELILINLQKSLLKKRENYKKVQNLKIKSTIEKDREFHDLIASENQYLNTQKEIDNLKIQIADLQLREAQLNRTIRDKKLSDAGYVLYSIDVKVGQVVGIATPLARIADVSKAKLTIFLDESDLINVKEKIVFINGEKTEYKISRILNIADSKNISKYKAQIIIKSPEVFSKLVKIELKKK